MIGSSQRYRNAAVWVTLSLGIIMTALGLIVAAVVFGTALYVIGSNACAMVAR